MADKINSKDEIKRIQKMIDDGIVSDISEKSVDEVFENVKRRRHSDENDLKFG